MDKSNGQSPEWKASLRQSNALGWLALALLVVAVLAGALTFGRGPEKVASEATQSQSTAR